MSKAPRPQLVTWISLGVLTLSALQAEAFLGALKLPDLPFALPRSYFLVKSALWSSFGLVSAVQIFRGAFWATRMLLIGSYSIAVWFWLERLLFASSEHELRSRPLAIVLTLVLLLSITLALRRRNVMKFFAERVL
jgi:hypothetical protein